MHITEYSDVSIQNYFVKNYLVLLENTFRNNIFNVHESKSSRRNLKGKGCPSAVFNLIITSGI